MQEQQALHNTSASSTAADTGKEKHASGEQAAAVDIDPNRSLGKGAFVALGAAVLVIAGVIFFGLHSRVRAESSLTAATREAAIESVSVIEPATGAGAQEIRLPANTQAYIDTPIYSRTNGYLQKWFADIGAQVHKGQLLAIVQTPEVDQQVEQAAAQVATAKANEQIAEVTSRRWKELLAKNAVSRQEADQALSDLNARTATMQAAEANLRRLQQMQGFERILAPFDGVLTARNVDIGSLIQGGDSNTPHSELFHLASINRLRVFVPVPEVFVSAVHDGEQVPVTTDAFPNKRFFGVVARNSTAIDPVTRTLNVEVDLNNSDHRLLPGAYAFVHLSIPAGVSSMTLPSNTLLFRAEGLRVGLVKDGRVHLQPIQIGHDYGATVEVISGLQRTDKVILNPSDSLAEGQQVRTEGSAI